MNLYRLFRTVLLTGIFFISPVLMFAQVSEVPVPVSAAKDALPRQVYKPAGVAQAIAFDPSGLNGESLVLPTSLQFGPDDRLYVAQKNGLILAYTIVRNGPLDYEVTDTESITVVKLSTPNHDDDGTPNSSTNELEKTRQITSILVVGTAQNPIIYATSSDPREGAGDFGGGINDSGLDTNSGVIHRLTKQGGQWTKVDLVRGLPRSEENHSLNGMVMDPDENILYVAVGGFTNGGAPSNNFARITEYALAAAILKVDLDMIDALPVQGTGNLSYVYDMPTLDDPTRPNVNGITDPSTPGYDGVDVGDPWGGNNGLNQSKYDPTGPVLFHATGFRNPYDIVITKTPGAEGRMYSIDNGANAGWGGHPVGEGSYPSAQQGLCTNAYDPAEPGSTGPGPNDGQVNNLNGLHYIRPVDGNNRYYAGHPTPVRGNVDAGLYTYFNGAGVFRTSTTDPTNPLPADWPPVPASEIYAAECDFRNSGVDDGSLVDYAPSTNGMIEYTASNFSNGLKGAILSAGFGGEIFVAQFSADGTQVVNAQDNDGVEVLFSNFGATPLDVWAQGDDDIFPGTVWAVTFGSQNVTIFEPVEGECIGGPGTTDDDNDGYTNDDEIANGTNECNAGDKPSDFDLDNVSDLLDSDDDNDGIDDVNDSFAIDPNNGIGVALPINYDLFNGDPAIGFFGVGFTGLMTNGSTDYLDQYIPDDYVFGGTAGLATIPVVTGGDALGGTNTQVGAFQLGIDVTSATPPFRALARVKSPFQGVTPVEGQSLGFFIGTGDQDNYLKVVVDANNGDGGIKIVHEVAGTPTTTLYANSLSGGQQIPDDVLGVSTSIDLLLDVDPAAGTAQPGYSIDGGEVVFVGPAITLSGATLAALQGAQNALAVGMISTSSNAGSTFTATWDRFDITYQVNDATAQVAIAPAEDINASTADGGSFQIENTAGSGQQITSVSFDLSTAIFPDIVFDPAGTAGDNTGKVFTPGQGENQTGLTGHTLSGEHNGADSDDGYDILTVEFNDFEPGETFTFSIDSDPTSIKGSSAPGPGQSGSVSGLEMAGTTVSVTFDDGTTQVVEVYRKPGSVSSSENVVMGAPPSKPEINVLGIPGLQATVGALEQNVRVSAPVNSDVSLLIVEGALFLPPGGGYDIDPFEANSAIQVSELTGNTGTLGFVDFEVTLTDSDEEGGLNYLAAVVNVGDGFTGPLSDVVVLNYDPDAVPLSVVRINAGGPAVSAGGVSWSADQYSTGGGTNIYNGDIAGTSMDVLYQTERFDKDMLGFSYQIPVPQDGTYGVTLHFAEIFFGAPGGGNPGTGKRVFTMDIEDGQGVLTDLDLFAEVGAVTAYTRTFDNIGVSDGVLDIAMTSSVREGKISAIEVFTFGSLSQVSAAPSPIAFSVAEVGASTRPRPVVISNNGTESITLNGVTFSGGDASEFSSNFASAITLAAGASDTLEVVFAPASAGSKNAIMEVAHSADGSPLKVNMTGTGQTVAASNVLYRINAGGPSLASLDGNAIWAEDQSEQGPNALGQAKAGLPSPYVNWDTAGDNTFGTLNPITVDASISGVAPPALFQTERWDAVTDPNMIWNFPVAADRKVMVNMYLAEIFLSDENVSAEGPRIFDIAVDGVVPPAFDNLDIFAEVGKGTGVLKSYQTESGSSGTLQIELIRDGGNKHPTVQGIELLDMGPVSTQDETGLPESFQVVGNYPNPFNPVTTVVFDVPEPAEVRVAIYDMLGREVLALPVASVTAGSGRQIQIDASELASGIYLYRVVAEMATHTETASGRMTLLK